MPIIPLLKPNLEPAMPQVPALDRVPRPQIDVRGVLASMQNLGDASQRRPIDERPFVEAAGAKGKAMGEGLNAAGSVLMDASRVFGVLAQKRQEAHEDRQIQQFHAEMRQENERRLAYQAKTPDTSKWRADAQSGAQRVSKPYENMAGVRPEVQQQLRGKAASFKTVTDIDTRARVEKAGFADTARAYAKNIDATIQFGDYDTSDGLIEEGGKRGYFSQEQVQGMLAQTAQRRREDQLMTVVQEHPQEAPEWFAQEDKLTEYKLTPWERREWEHRAQSFWKDHERQSVGEVLDGMHNGEITAVKQLEHWKPDMGPKAYADLSEMLAARRPAGVPKNDPAMREQTIATIANVKVRPGEVDSQIGLVKLGEDIKNSFTGGNREELLGRLEARVKSPDAGRESILGVALRNLNEWAFGHPVRGMNPNGPLADEGPVPTASITSTHASYPSVAERVKSIREDLEEAIKTGKLKTREDATDYVAKRMTASGRATPGNGAEAGQVPGEQAAQDAMPAKNIAPWKINDIQEFGSTASRPADAGIEREATSRSRSADENPASDPHSRVVREPFGDLSGSGQSQWGGKYIQAKQGGTKTTQIENEYNAETPWETKLELRDIVLRLAAPKGETLPRAISNLQYWFNNDPKRPDVLEIPYAEVQAGASYKAGETKLFNYFKSGKGVTEPKELVGLTLMDWAKAQPKFKPGDTIQLPDSDWGVSVNTGEGASPKAKEEKLFFSMGAFMIYGKGSGFTATKARDGSITITGNVTLSAADDYNWNDKKDGAQIPVTEYHMNKYKPSDISFTGFNVLGYVVVKDGFFKDLASHKYGRDFKITSKDNPTVRIEFNDRLPNVNVQRLKQTATPGGSIPNQK